MIRASKTETPPVVMEIIEPTEEERARNLARLERRKRNSSWWNTNGVPIIARSRGKHICVAGEECFVADTAPEAEALAKAAHPEDDGRFVMYIPKEKMLRIYANRRTMAPVP